MMHELEEAAIDQVPKEVDLKSTAAKEASDEETVETHTQQIDVFRCFKTHFCVVRFGLGFVFGVRSPCFVLRLRFVLLRASLFVSVLLRKVSGRSQFLHTSLGTPQ